VIRILVADDSAVIRTLLRGAIEIHRGDREAEIVEAGTGVAAVEKLREGGFDLALLDSAMPQLDGISAIRQLRAEGVLLPIIMVTANDDPAHRDAAMLAGATAYVVKPFRLEALWQVIEPLLP
jgi:two-component system response regulator MprA